MKNKKLTFIIVTFNSSKIIDKTLALIDQDKHKVIVVDSNSSDNTLDIVKTKFPKTHIIASKKNLGFGRANNLGFAKVDTEFACILDPDCFINDDSVNKILQVMNIDNNIAMANAISYNGYIDNKTDQVIKQDIDQIAVNNYIKNNKEYYNIKFASGCCMFIKTKIFRKIGLFDEKIFIYCEDNEICKRVLKNKYQIITVKDTDLIHLGGQSSDLNNNPKMQYFILWHKLGWSKCYYTEAVHNKITAKLKAIRNILRILVKIPIKKIKKQSLNLAEKAILAGCFAYLIGTKAFDKNDDPQMMP